MKVSGILLHAVCLAEEAQAIGISFYGCNCIKLAIAQQLGSKFSFDETKTLHLPDGEYMKSYQLYIGTGSTSIFKETMKYFGMLKPTSEEAWNGDCINQDHTSWFAPNYLDANSSQRRILSLSFAAQMALSDGK